MRYAILCDAPASGSPSWPPSPRGAPGEPETIKDGAVRMQRNFPAQNRTVAKFGRFEMNGNERRRREGGRTGGLADVSHEVVVERRHHTQLLPPAPRLLHRRGGGGVARAHEAHEACPRAATA